MKIHMHAGKCNAMRMRKCGGAENGGAMAMSNTTVAWTGGLGPASSHQGVRATSRLTFWEAWASPHRNPWMSWIHG